MSRFALTDKGLRPPRGEGPRRVARPAIRYEFVSGRDPLEEVRAGGVGARGERLIGGGRDEAVFVRVDEEAEPAALYAQFVVDYREVVAHRGLSDDGAEALRNLFVFKPFADESDYLALALRERRYLGRLGVCRVARANAPFEEPAGRAGFEPVVARAVNLLDGAQKFGRALVLQDDALRAQLHRAVALVHVAQAREYDYARVGRSLPKLRDEREAAVRSEVQVEDDNVGPL